jgi:hypothetical protein
LALEICAAALAASASAAAKARPPRVFIAGTPQRDAGLGQNVIL